MTLTLSNIDHHFDDHQVLNHVSVSVAPGEIVCLLGPSGSGKSTLLRLVAGLETLQQGRIELNGNTLAADGVHLPPEQRNIGLVFQDHALFPHLTVADNLSFGLQHLGAEQRRTVVTQRLDDIGLSGFESRYPHTLSGGQQQRVALARALAPEPAAMLLDEPFASVDATLRRRLREDARARLKRSNSPTIVVTHDPDEALELADRIAVMVEGRIVALDTPESIWQKPADRFVAELFGDAQTLPGHRHGNQVNTAFGSFTLPGGTPGEDSDRIDLVIRPQDVRLTAGGSQAMVRDIRFLGDHYLIIVGTENHTLRAVSATEPALVVGDQVEVSLATERVLIYPKT